MNIQKSFVNLNGIAAIRCPRCGISKNLYVKKFQVKQHTLNVRCSCGHTWSLQLDFRKHFRKKTNLPGIYRLKPPASGGGLITILDISRSGVGFNLTEPHSIEIGQQVRLRFTLDDKKNTRIDKLVVIKAIKGTYIEGTYVGCMFIEDGIFEKDLGFYLKS